MSLVVFTGLLVSLVVHIIKKLPAMQEMQELWVCSLSQEDSLEKEMDAHFSTLAWKIPLTG